MTTATMKTPTTDALADIQNLRVEMQQAVAAMLDPRDTPGRWTEREKASYEEARMRLHQHVVVSSSLTEQLTKAAATRARCVPARDRLRAAQAAIEQLIADAPDYRTIADARASKAEWARQNGLTASLTAIRRGVEYFNGQPGLPSPLRELLTDTCVHCGRAELQWPGPLAPLEEAIENAEALIATGPASLAALRTSVTPWIEAARLTEPVKVR